MYVLKATYGVEMDAVKILKADPFVERVAEEMMKRGYSIANTPTFLTAAIADVSALGCFPPWLPSTRSHHSAADFLVHNVAHMCASIHPRSAHPGACRCRIW
jgi:hypothetical protein